MDKFVLHKGITVIIGEPKPAAVGGHCLWGVELGKGEKLSFFICLF